MKNNISLILSVLLMLFWIILNERLNVEVFIIEIVVSASIYYHSRNFLPPGRFRITKLPLYTLYENMVPGAAVSQLFYIEKSVVENITGFYVTVAGKKF